MSGRVALPSGILQKILARILTMRIIVLYWTNNHNKNLYFTVNSLYILLLAGRVNTLHQMVSGRWFFCCKTLEPVFRRMHCLLSVALLTRTSKTCKRDKIKRLLTFFKQVSGVLQRKKDSKQIKKVTANNFFSFMRMIEIFYNVVKKLFSILS